MQKYKVGGKLACGSGSGLKCIGALSLNVLGRRMSHMYSSSF